MKLAALQQQFQDYVLSPRDPQADIHHHVAGTDGAQRLAVYHHAYRARLREALGEAYDLTWTYVGDDLFAQLCDGYIDAHPSTFRNLRWYGGEFAAHLQSALPDHPYLAELATLEWTLGLAFDAPDAAPFDAAAVAPDGWADQRLPLHPSVHFLELQWNTAALWRALKDGAEPPVPARGAPVTWLVWRQGELPQFRSLQDDEARALALLWHGKSFGVVAEAFADSGAAATGWLAGWLRSWLDGRLLVRP